MHKDSYSVFGRIDFFSVLQCLVICLSGTLQMEWTLFTPELTKVRFWDKILLPYTKLDFNMTICSQAIRSGTLDVSAIPKLCQELMVHWKSVTEFLSTHTVHQEMQGVRSRVRSLTVIVP